MDLSAFAMWKFKTVEGVLDGFRPSDMTTTKFNRGIDLYNIIYDLDAQTCEIRCVTDDAILPEECRFSELVDRLKRMGVYVKRPESECHSNALVPYSGPAVL